MQALNLWHAAILGLVEGITEYLPVSSTGHLILVSALLGLDDAGEMKRNIDAFEIVIQGGAILAVLGLYRHRVGQMIRGLLGQDASGLRLAINIIIAFMPAAIIGLLLHHRIAKHLFYPGPVIGALALGGVAMIAIGRWQRRRFHNDGMTVREGGSSFIDLEQLTWKQALGIGLMQCLALWPGTSRSMVTIVGSMVMGMRPRQAAEFSFLLGLPTLGAACCYSALKNFTGDGPNMIQTLGVAPIVVGILVATVSAALAVCWLVTFLSRHGLALFGWYRIALCAVIAVMISRGMLEIAPDATDLNHDAAASVKAPDHPAGDATAK